MKPYSTVAQARSDWLPFVCLGISILFAAGCESTGASSSPSAHNPPPLVAEVAPVSNSVAQGAIAEGWDGRGAKKVEFGRVVQSAPVIIDGRRTGAGALGGGLVGAAATVPKRATTGALVKTAGATVVGAVAGGKIEEIMTRQKGQEILIRLEEGKVVTVTQDAKHGYFQEGDFVKIVHGERGAYVSLTNQTEKETIKRAESEVRREGAWYERREDDSR